MEAELRSARDGACLRRRPTSWVIHVFGSLSLGATGASLVHPRNGVDDDGGGDGRTEAACEMKSGCVCEDEQGGVRSGRKCVSSAAARSPHLRSLRALRVVGLFLPHNEISPSAAPQILWLKILVQALSADAPSVCRLEKPLFHVARVVHGPSQVRTTSRVLLYIGLIEASFRTLPSFLFVLDLSLSIPVFRPLPQPSPHLPLPLRLSHTWLLYGEMFDIFGNAALVIVAERVSRRQNRLHVPFSPLPPLLDFHVEHLSPQSLIRVYNITLSLYPLCVLALARPFDDKPINRTVARKICVFA
jgi:hypothetical protein